MNTTQCRNILFIFDNSAAFSIYSLRRRRKFPFLVCSIDGLNSTRRSQNRKKEILRKSSVENNLDDFLSFVFLSNDPSEERERILAGKVNHRCHGRLKKISISLDDDVTKIKRRKPFFCSFV